jgi:hypothetical protein
MRLRKVFSIVLSVISIVQACTQQATAINGTSFPSLFDATLEDLIFGLEVKLFTSVDLVNVSALALNPPPA